jgi:hypothetical protein
VPPTSYVSRALPNRAALIVFTVSQSGAIGMRQMLRPVYSPMQFLE